MGILPPKKMCEQKTSLKTPPGTMGFLIDSLRSLRRFLDGISFSNEFGGTKRSLILMCGLPDSSVRDEFQAPKNYATKLWAILPESLVVKMHPMGKMIVNSW